MRLRHKKNAETDILNCPFCINTNITNEAANCFLEIAKIFGSSNQINLELGMGKGQFIAEMANTYKDINFIGIEKSATIVLKAMDKLIEKDILKNKNSIVDYNNLSINEKNDYLMSNHKNLRFMCEGVENIDRIFKEHSIDKIYLNFSDPWPKKRHETRRLTHHNFLLKYEKLLKPSSLLEFKTDNVGLFEFSLEEIKISNFTLLEYTYDLHNDKKLNENNIMTEYEAKFSKLGNKICKLIASTPSLSQ